MGTPMWLCYHTVSLATSEMRPAEIKLDGSSLAREHIQIKKSYLYILLTENALAKNKRFSREMNPAPL